MKRFWKLGVLLALTMLCLGLAAPATSWADEPADDPDWGDTDNGGTDGDPDSAGDGLGWRLDNPLDGDPDSAGDGLGSPLSVPGFVPDGRRVIGSAELQFIQVLSVPGFVL